MTIDERVAALARKLGSAAAAGLEPFGVEEHRMRLLPPVRESDVIAFETRHGVRLPEDYRAFIMRVAAGGAGPAYGLVPFDQAVSYDREELPEERVAKPFPFVEAYNPFEDPAQASYWQREGSGQLSRDDHLARDAARAHETAGSLVLCHEGCGHLHFLVVNGAAYGQMWVDSTVSDAGYAPLGATFLEWYERWLDSALAGGDGVWWMQDQ